MATSTCWTSTHSSCAISDSLSKEYGSLDVLVNNAGIAFKSKNMGTLRVGPLP